jgi:hypothetical protein
VRTERLNLIDSLSPNDVNDSLSKLYAKAAMLGHNKEAHVSIMVELFIVYKSGYHPAIGLPAESSLIKLILHRLAEPSANIVGLRMPRLRFAVVDFPQLTAGTSIYFRFQ